MSSINNICILLACLLLWAPSYHIVAHEKSVPAEPLDRAPSIAKKLGLSPDELAWLAAHRKIRIMNELDYAPYDFQINNQPAGYSIDFVKLVTERLGLEVEFVQDSWSNLLDKARSKEIDLMHSIFNSPPERHAFLNFTKPYKRTLDAIITHADNKTVSSLADLSGLSLVMVKADSALTALRDAFPDIHILEVDNYETALKTVAFGKADATVTELPVATYLINTLLISNLKVAAEVGNLGGRDHRYRLAVRKDWPEFIPILEKAMDSLTTGERHALDERWLMLSSAKENLPADTDSDADPMRQSQAIVAKPAASIIPWRNLLLGGVAIIFLVAMLLMLFRLLDRSSKNPLDYQFSSPTGKRVIILFNVFFILLSLSLTWWALANIKSKVKADVKETLQTVMETTLEAMTIWSKNQSIVLNGIARDPRLISLAEEQLSRYRGNENLKDTYALAQLRDLFSEYRQRSGYQGFFIIAPDGINLASMRDSNIEIPNLIHEQRPELLARVFSGESLMIPPITSDVVLDGAKKIAGSELPPTMFFAVPIRAPSGKIIAALAKRFDPHEDFTRINALGRIGNTGETYTFNRQGKLLSESRFLHHLLAAGLIKEGDQSILSIEVRDPGINLLNGETSASPIEQQPMTLMAASATQGNKGFNLEGYRDYRGVPVIGSWAWNELLGLGIASEIDVEEAMATYYSARITVVSVLVIMVLVSTVFTLFSMVLGSRANQALQLARSQLENRVRQRTQELRNSEERFALAMQGANIGIWDLFPQEQRILCNKTWALQKHYDPKTLRANDAPFSEIVNGTKRWTELVHPDDQDKTTALINAHLKGETETYQAEYRVKCGDGSWKWILDIGQVFEWDEQHKPKRMNGVNIDIDDIKKLQAGLSKAKTSADKANRAKSEFLASMSHEIRTPMNGVLGMLDLLSDSHLDNDQIRKVEIAQSSAKALLSLINDILDFSKVEAGKLFLEELDFDLRSLLEEIAKTMVYRAEEKGVELLLNVTGIEQSMVVGDASRLRQIVINLVGNAVKFTSQGEVVITANLVEHDNEQLKLICSIRDTGIGIPSDRIATLFESFTQVDASTTRQYGGSGLGLSISQKLCELMGGSIQARSELGKGSIFEFEVLLKSSKQAVQIIPSTDISQLKVLVVDDNATNREIFRHQLEHWGATVYEANNAETALEICGQHADNLFDIALIDMCMPGTDGQVLGKLIRSRKEFDHLKLIMMSSSQEQNASENLADFGFSGLFTKPVSTSDLFDALSVVGSDFSQTRKEGPLITKSYLETLGRQNQEITKTEVPVWPEDTKILLAEDNPINQIVAHEMLKSLALDCDFANDGLQAISKLQEAPVNAPYTLILMDCQMPEMDGYNATRAIREGKAGGRYLTTPIVAMTANAMIGDKEKCLQTGMDDYLTKPLESSVILNTLKKWLNPAVSTGERVNNADTTPPLEPKNEFQPKHSPGDSLCLPADLKTFDFSNRKPGIANNPTVFLKALSLYIKQAQSFSGQLETSIHENNLEQVLAQIHAIKGTSSNLGAYSIYDQAIELENDMAEHAIIDPEAIRLFCDQVQVSISDCEAIIAANTENKQITSSREYSEVRLELLTRLKKSELISEDLYREFKVSTSKINLEHSGRLILEAIDTFDYDIALDLLLKQMP